MHELLYARTCDPICYKYSYNIVLIKMSKPIPLLLQIVIFYMPVSGVNLEWDVGDSHIKHLESLEEEDDLEQQKSIYKAPSVLQCMLKLRVLRNTEKAELETWRSDSEKLSALDKFVQDEHLEEKNDRWWPPTWIGSQEARIQRTSRWRIPASWWPASCSSATPHSRGSSLSEIRGCH